MLSYVGKRLGFSLITLFLATTAAFFILAVIPGDLAQVILGDNATPAKLAQLRHDLGLNQPLILRYLQWVGGAIRLDFGHSALNHQDVFKQILSRAPITLELAILAQIIALVVALPAGVLSAVYSGRWLDLIIRPVSILGITLPSFWIALLVLLFPSYWWNYAPPAYISLASAPLKNLQLMLPAAFILGIATAAALSRLIRTTMLEVLREDYVRTARSKGLAERNVIVRHALRNGLGPVITVFALQFSALLGGTVVIESIFTLPGLGSMAIQAIQSRDYPLVQAFVVFAVFAYVIGSLLADLCLSFLDPRIRLT